MAALRSVGIFAWTLIDPESSRTDVVVDSETHRNAVEAFRREQDNQAIARGMAELEAAHGVELTVALDSIREKLGLWQRLS